MKTPNDDEPNTSPVFCQGYLNRVIVAANVSWRDRVVLYVRLRKTYGCCGKDEHDDAYTWLRHTYRSDTDSSPANLLPSRSCYECQRVRQDHGLHELINMSANTTRYRISCNDLTVLRLIAARRLCRLSNDDEPNTSLVFCQGYLNRVIVATNVSWRGDDDCLLCTVCGLLRPVSWLGNYTMCVIAAMSGVWCQRARQDHGLHELINMSANTKRYRISCNDLTVLRLIAARRLCRKKDSMLKCKDVSDRKRPDAYCFWQTRIKRFYCSMAATAQLSYIFNADQLAMSHQKSYISASDNELKNAYRKAEKHPRRLC
ncbi:hypothetical protein Tco_0842154 [Tanacetum coccineum]|uniref:Uncharacterized protein n=1 Tax=Tanacetum coccineum TaxID=301880 RepID=A0ABQ5B1Y1_9ASTR